MAFESVWSGGLAVFAPSRFSRFLLLVGVAFAVVVSVGLVFVVAISVDATFAVAVTVGIRLGPRPQ